MKKKQKLTKFEKRLIEAKFVTTSRIKRGKIIDPLSPGELQEMVDLNQEKIAELKKNGIVRDLLEVENTFKGEMWYLRKKSRTATQ